ncbi:hypothetical protein [Anaerophilus nitritogenes]|uniref:hypothetical protein n=1 Tax=Anaerophilus nitritogenes TaxID=2498136 RepID=UPI00101D028B|nr:hypothetical protein [Anaerophilus nitritogenes]
MKNSYPKLLEDQDLDNLIDLVKSFLKFCDTLLKKKMITQEQYLEMTYQKRKFLRETEKEVFLGDRKKPEYILEKI